MYEIQFSTNAYRAFKKLPSSFKQKIALILRRVQLNPHKFLKKLSVKDLFHLRVEDYRLIMEIIEDKKVILIIKIGHRRNVYKKI